MNLLFDFTARNKRELFDGIKDVLFLLGVGGMLIVSIGLILGIFLFISSSDRIIKRNKFIIILNKILSVITDTCRSIPFIVLIIALIPVTVILVGTMLGRMAAIPALVISAAPFFARIVSNSLKEVPTGTIEASKAMGASIPKIVLILLKEAMPSLVAGLTVMFVTLIGFIAAAGVVGAGGLGELAKLSASRREYPMMFISIGILLAIVFVIQFTGDFIAKKIDRR